MMGRTGLTQEAERWSAAFADAIGDISRLAEPGGLIGVEQEFSVRAGAGTVDFREVIHRLPSSGRRLDQGDSFAYRCPSGSVLTCDEREAEIALPPVALGPGFPMELHRRTAAATRDLQSMLPGPLTLRGFSTHISPQVQTHPNDSLAGLYAGTFGVAAVLLTTGSMGRGVMVRPRPGRFEVCSHFLAGRRLRVAASFVAGSVRACAAALDGGPPLPPALRARLDGVRDRAGWYVDGRAFGGNLVRNGRRSLVTTLAGETLRAQEHLELAWAASRAAVAGSVDDADLAEADAMVEGSAPLPSEGAATVDLPPPATGSRKPEPAPSAFGRLLEPSGRPGLHLRPVVARWDFTLFEIGRPGRRAYACVPRDSLDGFLAALGDGRLDRTLSGYLDVPPNGRILQTWQQADRAALFDRLAPDSLGPSSRLVAPEPWPGGGEGVTGGWAGRPGKIRLAGPHDRPPRGEPLPLVVPRKTGGGRRWGWIVAAIVAVLVVLGAAATVILSGATPGPPWTTFLPPTSATARLGYAVVHTTPTRAAAEFWPTSRADAGKFDQFGFAGGVDRILQVHDVTDYKDPDTWIPDEWSVVFVSGFAFRTEQGAQDGLVDTETYYLRQGWRLIPNPDRLRGLLGAEPQDFAVLRSPPQGQVTIPILLFRYNKIDIKIDVQCTGSCPFDPEDPPPVVSTLLSSLPGKDLAANHEIPS